MADYAKFNAPLAMALRAYEADVLAGGEPVSQGISVSIVHTGPLSELEAKGFIPHESNEGRASGVVLFKDLGKLSDVDQVEWISVGRPRTTDLDTAVTDISVRASSAALADGLWHAVTSSGAFTGGPKATGAGVIVAVIDTGIDYTHPMFMKQMSPTKQTRILRIWDQGLTPAAASDCPATALTLSTERYGVEFDTAKINAALNGGAALAHKDCDGHGTHVAGIAAGGPFFATAGDAAVMGVAPEADIIVVKTLDTPDRITYFTGPAGADVDFSKRWRDAILYCLRTAKALGKPVVINLSSGSSAEAGDGLDEDAVWVDQRMNPASAADNLHFPKGAVIVKSAGNEGDASRRGVARVIVPASGEVTVPIELSDIRGNLQTSFENCASMVIKPSVHFVFWYRRATPATAVTFALRMPTQTSFTAPMAVGDSFNQTFLLKPGPPPSLAVAAKGPLTHELSAFHENEPAVVHPNGATIRRQSFFAVVGPRTSGSVTYLTGTYEVKIKAPAGTELFLMCGRQRWAAGKGLIFKVAEKMVDGSAPSTDIQVTSEFSSADPLGRHVITVAAYDDKEGKTSDPDYRAIAKFSSRGPLRDYSNPPGSSPVIAVKPDIAAPGVKIKSARSKDADKCWFGPADWLPCRMYSEHEGTSMATPMVTGVVALMLHKKPDLHTAEVRNHLIGSARPPVKPSTAPQSTRAYGAGLVNGKAAHGLVP